MVTRRASHAHQTPHTGRPHSEPSTSVQPGEDHAELGRRAGDAVPDRRAGPRPQPERRGERGDAEREVRDPGRRDVQVHQALGVALHLVGRGAPEPEQREHDERRERAPAEHHADRGLSSLVLVLVARSCFLQERPEGQHPDRGEQHREHREQRRPRATRPTVCRRSPLPRLGWRRAAPARPRGAASTGTSVSRTRSPAASTP